MFKAFLRKIRKAHKSLTMWVNGVAAVLIPALPEMASMIPQMQPFLTPHFYQWVGGIVIGLNIILRFKTTKPMEDK